MEVTSPEKYIKEFTKCILHHFKVWSDYVTDYYIPSQVYYLIYNNENHISYSPYIL